MSYQSNYVRGSWNCICESCGRLVKAGELRQRWDGFMVDEQCWEPRQPQDFVRGVADYQAPPFTRPEQSDSFIPVTIIYDNNGQPIVPLFYSTATASFSIIIATGRLINKKLINGFTINSTTLG